MRNVVTRLRRAPATAVAALAMSLVVAAVAVADTIVGDADTSINATQASVTKAPGSSGTGSFYLEVDDNGTDPVSGCNSGGNNPPVVLNVSSDSAWLTLAQSSISPGCGQGQAASVGFSVSPAAPAGATATVTASYASGGKPGGSYTPGRFTVVTPAQADTTPPVIVPSVVGTLGDNGWHVSDVAVSWDVSDSESSVTTDGCGPVTIDADTTGTTLTCVAESDGGQDSDSVTIKRDATAPTTPAATTDPVTPDDSDGGWFRDGVTVSYDGSSDATSGVAGYSAPEAFSTSGEHSYSGTATDLAGNVSSPATGTVKVDADIPYIDVAGCPEGPVEQGSAHSLTVEARDAESGLAEGGDPSGSVVLATSTLGQNEAIVTAVDRVGHEESDTCEYEVVAAEEPNGEEPRGEEPNNGGQTPGGGGGQTPTGTQAPPAPQTPLSPAGPADDAAPVISNLRAAEKCLRNARLGRRARGRRDIAFRYDLSEAATVTLSIQRRESTRRARTRCPGARRKSKGEGTPDTYTEVGSQQENAATGGNRNRVGAHQARSRTHRFVGDVQAGMNRLDLSALASTRRLAPGLYRLVAVAEDAAGNRSAPVIVKFWVLGR